jgi:hypothetical protein
VKLKVKYFSYNFLLLPLCIGLLYGSIQVIVQGFLLNGSAYRDMSLVLSCLIFSIFMLCTVLPLRGNEFVIDVYKYAIILYLSCLISAVIYFLRFNLGITNYCPFNYDILHLKNVYVLTFVCTTITNMIFFFIIQRVKLSFSLLHLVIFICAMIVQFYFTRGFRMI